MVHGDAGRLSRHRHRQPAVNQAGQSLRDKSLNNYLTPSAFAYPTLGTLGNHRAYSIEGPGFWTVDLALTRLVSVGTHRLEFRIETFNLFNNFNWGDPTTNLDAGTFGRITTQTGDPRILQFGFKYGF